MKNQASYLNRLGIKPSLQRLAIYNYLQTHRTHPTAEEIYLNLSPSIPTLSKTTVYNTLTLFAAKGAVLQLTIDDKNLRFDGYIEPHTHFQCEECGIIWDFPLPEIDIQKTIPDDLFVVRNTDLYLRGVCKSCLNK